MESTVLAPHSEEEPSLANMGPIPGFSYRTGATWVEGQLVHLNQRLPSDASPRYPAKLRRVSKPGGRSYVRNNGGLRVQRRPPRPRRGQALEDDRFDGPSRSGWPRNPPRPLAQDWPRASPALDHRSLRGWPPANGQR